jgi:archaemetzincin
VPRDLLERLAGKLGRFDADVVVHPSQPLPLGAFDPRRGQFRSDHLLRRLRDVAADRVLGVADVDLYVDPLNFVFGQADVGGRAAVISTNRLASPDRDLFELRALKEAVHELGHTFGLAHCEDDGCIMHFSNTLEDTDRKGTAFCATCRGAFEARGGRR